MTPVDTSVIYALLDRADRWHSAAAQWYRAGWPELVTTPLVLAEVDHLAEARLDTAAVAAWRADLSAGAYGVEWWGSAVEETVAIAEQYEDLRLGLTDASLVALAARLGTTDIATLDERHFRAVRPLSHGSTFRLLPVDG